MRSNFLRKCREIYSGVKRERTLEDWAKYNLGKGSCVRIPLRSSHLIDPKLWHDGQDEHLLYISRESNGLVFNYTSCSFSCHNHDAYDERTEELCIGNFHTKAVLDDLYGPYAVEMRN